MSPLWPLRSAGTPGDAAGHESDAEEGSDGEEEEDAEGAGVGASSSGSVPLRAVRRLCVETLRMCRHDHVAALRALPLEPLLRLLHTLHRLVKGGQGRLLEPGDSVGAFHPGGSPAGASTRAAWCSRLPLSADLLGKEGVPLACAALCRPAAHACPWLLIPPSSPQEHTPRAQAILVAVEAASAALHLLTVPGLPARGGSMQPVQRGIASSSPPWPPWVPRLVAFAGAQPQPMPAPLLATQPSASACPPVVPQCTTRT